MNPLLPTGYDLVWTAVAVVVLALTIVTLVSLARVSKRLSVVQSLMWALLAIFAPVLGSLAWFFVGRPAALQQTR